MKLEIRLANGSLDLPPNADKSFYITKQLHRLQDLQTREGTYSKTLIVPNTNNNRELLGDNIPSLSRHSGGGSSFIDVGVLLEGIPVIDNAFMRVQEEKTKDKTTGFELTFFSGLVGFYNLIPDNPVSAVNFSDLNFEWTLSNVFSRKENTVNDGIVCPESRWVTNSSSEAYNIGGSLSADGSDDQDINTSGFFFYVKNILDRIFAQISNFTIDWSEYPTDHLLYRLGISCRMDFLFNKLSDAAGYKGTADLAQAQYAGNTVTVLPVVASSVQDITLVGSKWIIPESGDVVLYANGVVQNNISAYGGKIELMVNDSVVGRWSYATASNSVAWYTSVVASVNTNDEVYLRLTTPSRADPVVTTLNVEQFTVLKGQGGSVVGDIEVGQWMPNIGQREFVKAVFEMFHIVPVERDKTIIMYPWDKIPTNGSIEKEYNSKLEVKERAFIQSYGLNNICKYSQNSLIRRTDTVGQFLMAIPVQTQAVTKIQSSFFPMDRSSVNTGGRATTPAYDISRSEEISNTISFFGSAPQFTYSTVEGTGLVPGDIIVASGVRVRVTGVVDNKNGAVSGPNVPIGTTTWRYINYSSASSPEMMLCELLPPDGARLPVTYRDGGNQQTTPFSVKAFFSDDLKWGNILPKYYPNFINSITVPYVFIGWFIFTAEEFQRIDQLEPLYIPSLGTKFYINILEQYKADGSTRCELIRVLPTVAT